MTGTALWGSRRKLTRERHRILRRSVLVLVLVGVLSLSNLAGAGARQAGSAPRYTATDLGSIKDHPSTLAHSLNAKGVVSGQAVLSPELPITRAAVYRGGKLRALIKGETGYSSAVDINASSQVVGYAASETSRSRAMLWEADEATDLGDLVG